MAGFYPLLSLLSRVVFAWFGYVVAAKRHRNKVGCAIAGAVFPPLLLIVAFMSPLKRDDVAAEQDAE
ncbi:MAG: hypothetical protein RLN70_13205 [Rhodospirillaceae bacterium]